MPGPTDPFEAIFNKPPVERPTHPAGLDDEALMAQCEWSRSRGSGPGGQNRNKVETTVELRHRSSGVRARAGERRSVKENKSVALRRLRLELAVRVRVGVPDGEIRSRLWRSRCVRGKISVSPKHRDFPAMLAEAMDVLEASLWEPRDAAIRLDCTPTQLVRLVKDYPPAQTWMNERRHAMGKHALK